MDAVENKELSVNICEVWGATQFVAVFGSPRSGKSFMERSIIGGLLGAGLVRRVTVFSPNHDDDWDVLPPEWRRERTDDAEIERIMAAQRALPEPDAPEHRIALVFDDMLGVINWGSGIMTNLVTTYRHLGIYLFVSTQQVSKIPTIFREACSMAIIFKQPPRATELIYGTFGGDFANSKEFGLALDANTNRERHEAVVYSRAGIGAERVSWVRYVAPADSDQFEISVRSSKRAEKPIDIRPPIPEAPGHSKIDEMMAMIKAAASRPSVAHHGAAPRHR